MATCRGSGPPLARCNQPTPSLNLEEDSADSEVDWEAVSGWGSRSDDRAEEDSYSHRSASSKGNSRTAAPGGAPPREEPSRAVLNFLHFADRLLSRFYHCAVRRFTFFLIGRLLSETKEKELYGYTARTCPQVARRKRHSKAFGRAKRALPRKTAHSSYRWGYFVNYCRRLGIPVGDPTCPEYSEASQHFGQDAGPTDESDSAVEA